MVELLTWANKPPHQIDCCCASSWAKEIWWAYLRRSSIRLFHLQRRLKIRTLPAQSSDRFHLPFQASLPLGYQEMREKILVIADNRKNTKLQINSLQHLPCIVQSNIGRVPARLCHRFRKNSLALWIAGIVVSGSETPPLHCSLCMSALGSNPSASACHAAE
eukprot:Gb_01208 [translate_table: standard]